MCSFGHRLHHPFTYWPKEIRANIVDAIGGTLPLIAVLKRGVKIGRYIDNWRDHARHSESYARAKEMKEEKRKPGKSKSILWPFR